MKTKRDRIREVLEGKYDFAPDNVVNLLVEELGIKDDEYVPDWPIHAFLGAHTSKDGNNESIREALLEEDADPELWLERNNYDVVYAGHDITLKVALTQDGRHKVISAEIDGKQFFPR